MGLPAQELPPGFIRFQPFWYNKLRKPFQSTGYHVFINQSVKAFLDTLSPYQHLVISQKLYSFAGNPRPDNEIRHMKNTTDKYYIPERKTGFSITYEIVNGGVYVTSIVPDLNAFGEHKEVPGCHLVTKARNNTWTVTKKNIQQISTPHAAINGQSNILKDAQLLMAKHILSTYGENIREFTLFHNPSDGGMWDTYESSLDKRGKTTAVTKIFSEKLRLVQQSNSDVKWVAHSQGGIIFTEAVRYHLVGHKTSLNKNSVTFNAGTNNIQRTEQFLPLAGIKIHGYNDHPFDFVPQLLGGHHNGDITKVIGSVIHAGYVTRGKPEHSPHTLPYSGMENYVSNMPSWYKVIYKTFK